jgi:hypothetical protein
LGGIALRHPVPPGVQSKVTPHAKPLMLDLDSLWKSRLNVLVANLINNEKEHREIANLAEQIEADYHGRFLVELLQNANDQATKAGLLDAEVLVVRTEDHLAVFNQGDPFDDEGIRSITSLGVSSKLPEFCLGNKGIGFKSVFQVSLSPSIISGSRDAARIYHPGGFHFRMAPQPFEDPQFVTKLRELLSDVISSTPGASHISVDRAMQEAKRAAPFKFPLPLDQGYLDRCIGALNVPDTCWSEYRTAVILPLRKAREQVVHDALEQLLSFSGATILFLKGISKLTVLDHYEGVVHELERHGAGGVEVMERGVRINLVNTRHRTLQDDQLVSDEDRRWWVASRSLGNPNGMNEHDHREEAARLAEAVQDLPGDAWTTVEEVPVSIALPLAGAAQRGSPLGAMGKFCIGLPTLQATGTPLWVHSHFHGNISRTEIDFTDLPYNRLLLNEATDLFGALLERLRSDPALEHRQAVTLAFERSDGVVADALFADGGLAHTPVVLHEDGDSFLTAEQLAMPASEDFEMFIAFRNADVISEEDGFVLPHDDLLLRARPVLDALAGYNSTEDEFDSRYLRRQADGASIIERAALVQRNSGSEFWTPFLEWILDSFPADAIRTQAILPVGEDDLTSAERTVFYRPSRDGDDLDGHALADLAGPARELPFFDDRTIPVRSDDGYSTLARRLSAPGHALVRAPETVEIINHLLIPRFVTQLSHEGGLADAVRLLAMILRWTDRIGSEKELARLKLDLLRVPALSEADEWQWVPPAKCYFGQGWVDAQIDGLLAQAFGDVPGARLVPWHDFARLAEISAAHVRRWTERLGRIGVSALPRLRSAPDDRQAPLESWGGLSLWLRPVAECPWPEVEHLWRDYVERIRHRTASTTSGQRFDVRDLVWIDGLEREDARTAVFDLMLRSSDAYIDHTTTSLGRQDRRFDRTEVPTLWAHAIQTGGWAVVPTSHGRRPVDNAWLLSDHDRAQRRYGLLPVVAREHARAGPLLEQLGVTDFTAPTTSRIITALHTLADRLGGTHVRTEGRDATALATELYVLLQRSLDGETSGETLSGLLDRPVPLQSRELIAANLREVDVVFVDDDPVRAEFVVGFGGAPRLPTRARTTYARLVEALRSALGEHRVLRTSEAPVETGFTPIANASSPSLIEFVEEALPAGTVVKLAALLAFGGRDTLEPEGEGFQKRWDLFKRTKIERGTFPLDAAARSFFDEHGEDDPVLQTRHLAEPAEVLEASWRIFGTGHRDVISAFSQRVDDPRETVRFLHERGIGAEEFARVEAVMRSDASTQLGRARALGLALARRSRPDATIAQFADDWEKVVQDDMDPTPMWGVSRNFLLRFGQFESRGEEATLVDALKRAGASVESWQSARRALGEQPWVFSSSDQAYREEVARLIAEVSIIAARRHTVDLGSARQLVDWLDAQPTPTEIRQQVVSPEVLRRSALRAAQESLDGFEVARDSLLVERINRELAGEGHVFLPRDLSQLKRELHLYRTDPEPIRSRHATEFLDNIVSVARELAPSFDETVDQESIRDATRIRELSAGWLANQYALAPTLRDGLEAQVPRTTEALVSVDAFRSAAPVAELRRKVGLDVSDASDELGDVLEATALGIEGSFATIEHDLRAAGGGEVGAALGEYAEADVDLGSFRLKDRPVISTGFTTPGLGGGGGGGGPAEPTTRRERELNGLLGEAFIFETFRRRLPNFDASCWVSKNRERYGTGGEGSDVEGYDFRYVDEAGLLTGSETWPTCLIEVKATSERHPKEFTLSRNEMDVARKHSGSDAAVYMIVWVAEVRTRPHIFDILIDPMALWLRRSISLTWKDLRVHVG